MPITASYTCLLLRGSRSLTACYLAIGALAVTALALLPLPGWVRALAGIVCLAPIVNGVRCHGMRRAVTAVVRVELLPDARCRLTERGGAVLDANHWQVELTHPWLIILRVSPGGRHPTIPVLIAADAVAADDHRRLRVRLRCTQPGW